MILLWFSYGPPLFICHAAGGVPGLWRSFRVESRCRGASVDTNMPLTPVSELIPVLQVAIGPVILISGVGLLLLTLTNRYGRTIDRSRQLVREQRECTEADRHRLDGQVEILYR